MNPSVPGKLPRTLINRRQTTFVHGPENKAERPPKIHHVDWHRLYPSAVILHGSRRMKQISLTFDDGPDDHWTPQIIRVLSSFNVRATFSCVGQQVLYHPNILRKMVRDGHILANHSFNHPNFTKISVDEARNQLNYTSDVIQNVVGLRPRFFRPPYGALNEEVIRMIIKLEYKVLYWDVDSLDWSGLTADQVSTNVLAHTEPGSIILMHCAGGVGGSLEDTVQALPYIIKTLRREGYRFVTIPELLNQSAYAPMIVP